jgi:2-C-methyl-D-erythritol 4-phosphate cytidylyltransferase
MKKNRFAVIVAGGSGNRMGVSVPKQFLPLRGIPVLMHTLTVFHQASPRPSIYLVLPINEQNRWKELCQKHSFTIPHKLISGGETRFQSVKNGLLAIEGEGIVAIHDGVRPLVTSHLIEECFITAEQKGNAVPAIRPYETIRSGSNTDNRKENREDYWLIQTPQVFKLDQIRGYYQMAKDVNFTDDASVAEDFGTRINILEGNRENIKITTPIDIAIAEAILDLRGKK